MRTSRRLCGMKRIRPGFDSWEALASKTPAGKGVSPFLFTPILFAYRQLFHGSYRLVEGARL